MLSQTLPSPAIRWLIAVLVGSVAVAVPAALWSVSLVVSAESARQTMEAGGRFGYTLFVFPAFAGLLAVVFMAPALVLRLLGSRMGLIGVGIGLLAVAALAIYFVAGTPSSIRHGGGLDFCPSGVPPWWPSWLPQ